MSHIEKEKLIKADMDSIENIVRHTFNQGYDLGFKDGKKRAKPLEQEPTTKNDLGVDLISRADVLKLMQDNWHTHNGDWAMQESMDDIRALPSVTPQEPKIVPIAEIKCDKDKLKELVNKAVLTVTPQEPKCKDCKWWKDSDGEYRRGCGAESQCPINRREVFEGIGYCYMFEPEESEDKE